MTISSTKLIVQFENIDWNPQNKSAMKFISLNTITDCRPTNNYLCSTNVR